MSGIAEDKRKEIERLASLHGGIFSKELHRYTCTHLLTDVPKGEKYYFAQKWSIKCNGSQWFYDCITAGYCLDEVDYRTLPDSEQSLMGQSEYQRC